MNEPRAWLGQAGSDYESIERALILDDPRTYCHAIAKCQQAVEKSVKGLARAAGMMVGPRHPVLQTVEAVIRLAQTPTYRDVVGRLRKFFSANIRNDILALDRLAPSLPAHRNTEYPFPLPDGSWTFPGQPDVFSRSDLDRFRALAYRVLAECQRFVSALERRPP